MAPLGNQYMNLAGGSETSASPSLTLSPDTVNLQATEQYQSLSNSDEQKIDILVLRKDNQQPMTGIKADLTITLPDKSQYTATFPETGLDGRASLIIPAMSHLNNGQILEYQVCLNDNVSTPVCVNGTYLIWSLQ
jgi:hypothetical protein